MHSDVLFVRASCAPVFWKGLADSLRDRQLSTRWLQMDDALTKRLAFPLGLFGVSEENLPPLRATRQLSLKLRVAGTLRRAARREATLFYTLAPALWAAWYMERVPSVIVVDAAPSQHHQSKDLAGEWVNVGVHAWRDKVLAMNALAAARRVVAHTQWAADALRDTFEVLPERIRVLHPGVESASGKYTGASSGRVLFMAYDKPWHKGVDTALAALEGAGGRWPLDVAVDAMLGPRTSASQHGAVLRGDERARTLLAQAALLVLPARFVVYPWELLDAMALGIPIVTTRVGPIPEIVGDGDRDACAVFVPPDDPSALREAVDALLADGARRQALGAAGRARAERLFALRDYAGGLAEELARAAFQVAP